MGQVIGNKSEAAYRRGDLFDRRWRLVTDWAIYGASERTIPATVNPIRGEAA